MFRYAKPIVILKEAMVKIINNYEGNYRKAHFNAAHRLYRKIGLEKKRCCKCNNPNYHGHNYELIVGVTGEMIQRLVMSWI
jgi:6-pyruvoyltetrahydropterin/6-carboxytetrahydropterin synthase